MSLRSMTTNSLKAALFGLLLSLPSTAHAWWDYGHKTIATIAWDNAKPVTRARIRALLAYEKAVDTPQCPLRSIEDASYWPDCVKPIRPRFDYAYNWHFQNVDICKPFYLTAACKDGNCVSAQVAAQLAKLKNRKLPGSERLMALAFLTHFVGDLHMPLHAGDRGDRGGNDLKARYGMVGGRINIHSMWDGYLAERAITTPPAGAKGLEHSLTAAAKRRMMAGTVADWSRESWEVARDKVYAPALGGNACAPAPERAEVSNAQIVASIPDLRLQILRGGLRLSRLLDEALGQPGTRKLRHRPLAGARGAVHR